MLGLCEGGGEPCGDAFMKFFLGDVADAFVVIIAHVLTICSVCMDVDKAWECVLPCRIMGSISTR